MLDWHSCQICYSLEIKVLLLSLFKDKPVPKVWGWGEGRREGGIFGP